MADGKWPMAEWPIIHQPYAISHQPSAILSRRHYGDTRGFMHGGDYERRAPWNMRAFAGGVRRSREVFEDSKSSVTRRGRRCASEADFRRPGERLPGWSA